jgi:hypothetical protein
MTHEIETAMTEDTAGSPEGQYEYGIGRCDVQDKERLRQYRRKRTEWLHLLNGDPLHSIWKQISTMLWNDAVFRVVNESRGLASERGCRSAARNGMLASLLDQGYVATQALAIRRLMEKAASSPDRQVVSLRRLLDDIKAHRDLLTREVYVGYDGLPYDPEPGRERFYEQMREQMERGRSTYTRLPTSGPKAWSSAERAHEGFDGLSGVAPPDRARGDVVCTATFQRLESELKSSGWRSFVQLSNKFIAHSADLFSRESSTANGGLTLKQITQCHRALYQVANYIDSTLLWHSTNAGFPTPQFNQFDQLDAPWVMTEDIRHLALFWDEHVATIDAWTSGSITDHME